MASPAPSQTTSSLLLVSFVKAITAKLGDTYVFGAAGPNTFDCSGLVQWGLQAAGWKNVPRTSEAQFQWAQKIQASDLEPGDLVFSQWPGDGTSPGHVAVYVGGGDVIEAPETGVPVHKVPLDANYKAHVVGYGRPPQGSTAGDATSGSGSAASTTTVSWWSDANPALGFLGGNVVKGIGGAATGVGDVATAAGALATEFGTMFHWLSWLFAPSNWLRIGAAWFGTTVFILAIYFMVKAASATGVTE